MVRIVDQIWEAFLSRVGEIIADYAHNKLESNFKLITLKTLQKNLNSLSVKACDVEEQIKNAERSGKKKRKREVEEWLREVKSINETQVVELGTRVESQGFIRRLMNGEVAQLNEQVCKLLEQTCHFGELVFDICGIRGEKMLTTRMVGEAFERNSERIWSVLEGEEVLSIGVHGMGGVGKTTLAKGIYNRLLETYGNRSVFWITVSQEFTIKSLQDKIGRLLGVDLLDEDNEDIRAGKVRTALSEMEKAILILDDVWKNIDLLKVGCPFSVECCRLIMTTRSLEVCRQIGCEEVIVVDELGEDEAWKLFHETFTLGKEIKLDPPVEAIAKSVAKKCGGLALGIITLAGSMRGQTTEYAWRNALEELKKPFTYHDGMIEGDVFKVLKYSFDRLHANHSKDFNSLQLCFLYLSLYPEDEEVYKETLIEDFISEGLLDTRQSRRAQFDQGRVILDKLVNVCLFEHGFVGGVKMHDLVRGMALKVCEGKYMVRAGDRSLKEIPMEEEWTEDVEKVSLMDNDIRRIEGGTSPDCPKLSTLLLQGNRKLELIPDSFFKKMQGLCTLILSRTKIMELPQSLSDLKSLKALRLDYCEMLSNVPYLGNLKALRELNLSYTKIEEVPKGVEELLNLRFLSMEGADRLQVIRSGLLRRLGSLQYVSFPYHLKPSIEGILNLKELEDFRGTVESVRDFNCFIGSDRDFNSYLLYVEEVGNRMLDSLVDDSKYNNKVVILIQCSLADEVVVSGQDIEVLEMRRCEGLSKCLLDDINNPTSLRRLIINECGGIEFILSAPESSSRLSRLEKIDLGWLKDFKGVIDTPAPAPPQCVFLSLKSLYIVDCDKMRKLGLPVSGFPNLEQISILRCGEIEEIFEDEGRGESVTLPKLTRLRLWGLPRLESVCRTTLMICNSIQVIQIDGCPRLMKKLPVHLDVPPPPNLREIRVEREWWESLEWDNPDLPRLLQPSVRFW